MASQANSRAEVSPEHDLSLLALKAAMQIDAIRRKETVALNYIAQLTERLRGGWDDRPAVDHVKELAPPAAGVMEKAVSAFSGKQLDSNEDLAGGITELIAKLNTPLEKAADEVLDRLLSFCVTLHDELLLQKRFFDETKRPKSRYRV